MSVLLLIEFAVLGEASFAPTNAVSPKKMFVPNWNIACMKNACQMWQMLVIF
jgi:hypothetical protein